MFIDFRKRGREGERQKDIDVREKHQSVSSRTHPDTGLNHSLAMCPDWELNLQPFGTQDNAPTEPPGQENT